MSWQSPTLLLLLWLLPAAAWLLAWSRRRQLHDQQRFLGATLAAALLPGTTRGRVRLRGALWLGAMALLLAAAARPAFGVYFEQVSARGADLVICLDVSRSMLAGDVAPNRLERARSDLLDLLDRLEGHRVALVAFAGKAVTVCPLTTDLAFLRQALREVGVHSAPRGGSLIGDALRAALATMEARADRDQAVLLISDGEDQDSAPLEAAQQAAERGVRVYAVGLGDVQEGSRIAVPGADGGSVYLRHEGQEVWSKLNPGLLREIALKSGGAFVNAGTRAYDLGQIYEEHLAGLARSETDSRQRQRLHERFQWFAGPALVLLLARLLLPRYRYAPSALPNGGVAHATPNGGVAHATPNGGVAHATPNGGGVHATPNGGEA